MSPQLNTHSARLCRPPGSVGRDDELADDLRGSQMRAEPEQHPHAGAVDVAQRGQVEGDTAETRGDTVEDLLLNGCCVRDVDLTGDADTGRVAVTDDGDGSDGGGGYGYA